MVTLKLRTKGGHIQSIEVDELLEINGKSFQLTSSLEERVQNLEATVGSIVAYLQQPEPEPPAKETSDAPVRN